VHDDRAWEADVRDTRERLENIYQQSPLEARPR
jgi:hypothetical protein